MIYKVKGPTKLSGTVNLQGAKNSGMKHVIAPLLTNGKFVLNNIPKISSVTKTLDIMKLFGCKVSWNNNTLSIDSLKVTHNQIIPAELLFHTSGGILLIPIIVGKFGSCVIEKTHRKDTGGDAIGRKMSMIDERLRELGINKKVGFNTISYEGVDNRNIKYNIPNRSFGVTMLSLYTALSRKGNNTIYNPCTLSEFEDILTLLQRMGGKIRLKDDSLLVEGGVELSGVTYKNMYDKHDFVTFLSAALMCESNITIANVDYKKMKLVCLNDFTQQAGIKLQYDTKKHTCVVVRKSISSMNPVNIYAGEYPNTVTEWQVLLSPIVAKISGKSRIVEGIFLDRMRHWEELGKFGARYKYVKDTRVNISDGNPQAVDVYGTQKFRPAHVKAKDVRAGAAMIIAALSADGESLINDPEGNIERGYQDLSGRLNILGANIVSYEKTPN